ncbi:probable hexosyltransferase MUCI70 isoform X3 [Beta vulgaris subsp. vulgaris]|uniref:probable hexosyltransferase MUCI70 isoform X3 n=1 Tax=Beta vulgaris subsp. vulgaris TaxID=3555 RepID=UPI002036F83C|nr:probable hexosyltransferase MUCI70 isoform X3 [Beta vulgaris subsp. vulgaris]
MAIKHQKGDVIVCVGSKSNERGDGVPVRVARRAKRFGWISRQRLSVLLLLIGAIFFICMTFFSVKVHFHGENEDGMSSFFSVRKRGLESNITKKKRSSKHYPCDVEFAKSVEYILEPKDYLNFTNFDLDYIGKEEKYLTISPYKLRFNGHQTLEERERSFYARNQSLHCGFIKGPDGMESTGFDLEEKDQKYMKSCAVVVSSCIFGSSDFLRRPTSKLISEYSKTLVCFVMFLDGETLSKLFSEGNVLDERGHMGLWRIVVVKDLPYEDMRRTGKVPKLLAHRLFPSSRYSIWLDSKMRLNADPLLILEHFLWRTKSEYAISKHYDRQCVWEEVLQNKRLNKYDHTAIDEQFKFYQADGLTKFNASDPHIALPSYVPEGSLIVRAHTPMSNLFSCLWFNEVDRFTSRDQLSFAHTYLKLKRMNTDRPFFLNMFKSILRRTIFFQKAVSSVE